MAYGRLRRNSSHRRAMLRNITTSFLDKGSVITTEQKARELRPLAEKMITLGKRGDLHARRQALAYLTDEDVVTKVFSTHAERYMDRNGGYVRIVKLGLRQGDSAQMVKVELV